MKQTGLGKGLAALLSDFDLQSTKQGEVSKPVEAGEIEISKIDANPHQPRKTFDESSLKELSDSIKLHGVIQPILVNRNGSRYIIIAGERRFRAAKLAGLKSIPVNIKNYNLRQIKEIALIENLQREDLNAIETATGIKQLMDEFKCTQEEVAERLGKSRPQIANLLRLLNLSPPVIELVRSGRLSAGHARALVVVDDKALQLKLADAGCDNRISVRDMEKLVKDAMLSEKDKPVKPAASLELKELIGNMQKIFATKVKVIGNDNKGRICIDYFSRSDLDRISDIIHELNNNINIR